LTVSSPFSHNPFGVTPFIIAFAFPRKCFSICDCVSRGITLLSWGNLLFHLQLSLFFQQRSHPFGQTAFNFHLFTSRPEKPSEVHGRPSFGDRVPLWKIRRSPDTRWVTVSSVVQTFLVVQPFSLPPQPTPPCFALSNPRNLACCVKRGFPRAV